MILCVSNFIDDLTFGVLSCNDVCSNLHQRSMIVSIIVRFEFNRKQQATPNSNEERSQMVQIFEIKTLLESLCYSDNLYFFLKISLSAEEFEDQPG